MNKVKNLGYDRWLIYKQVRQESSLCCFSVVLYHDNKEKPVELKHCETSSSYRVFYPDETKPQKEIKGNI